MRRPNWIRRRIADPILALLRQGITPGKLALSLAFGVGFGIFPVLGVGTPALTFIALAFRLNLPAVQLVSYLLSPLQLLLIIPFVRIGERVLGAAPQPLSVNAGLELVAAGAWQAAITLRDAILHAALGWILVGPALIYVLFLLFRPLLVRAASLRVAMNTTVMETAAPSLSMRLLERDLAPDWLIRNRIRALLAARLREEDRGNPELQQQHLMDFVARLKASPVAINTADANAQHYEVPTEFYLKVLGKHLKYSSCYYEPGDTLDAAEARMLELTCRRARLADGDRILELGCGWGSLSLWMAQHYPDCRITAVSNSRTQKAHIDARARERGLTNLEIVTCDMNVLEFPQGTAFDRVVSVEMFEHMRNYEELLRRVASWMSPAGTLFVHIFTHERYAYPFEVRDETDWMAQYFFSGGIMPSDDLLLYFQRDVRLAEHWQVSGTHYQATSEAWLANMDRHKPALMPLFETTYGKDAATRWWVYWRVFFMSCAELWGYRGGREWLVSHYLFEKR